MKNKHIYILLFLVLTMFSFSQPGKNGSFTVTTANTILNNYSPVNQNISAGSNYISVVAQSQLLNLCPGDLIMIYQAQGANISTLNSANYGLIFNYYNAGIYEFVYVKSVSGNIIITASSIINNYTASGMVQVVKVPLYSTLTVNSGAKIIAKDWKDTLIASVRYRFGGIVSVHASSIVNNGTITTTGAGFRGGKADTLTQSGHGLAISVYTSTNVIEGGEKGEGIAGYQPEYNLIGGRYCRGAAANGGGGGNAWNAGGGGGANGDNSNIWNGQGVMSNTVTGSSAWILDPAYIANGNALTTSSGGGRGGYSVGYQNMNPLVTGPNNSSWGLDGRQEVGGLGGRPLTNINYNNRIYFGGGGGTGDDNDNCSTNGGNGGGIVYLVAGNSITGSGLISSNGNNGGNTKNSGVDAPSGAGAGGSIVILSGFIAATQSITAIGGNGGNQNITFAEFEGPGGGGGGGFVAVSSSTLVPNVSGGANGTTNSAIMSSFPANGATAGANGQTVIASNTFMAYDPNAVVNMSSNSPVCSGSALNLSAGSINGAAYSWSGPNGFTSNLQNPSITNVLAAASGNYYLIVSVAGCSNISNVTMVTVNDCTGITESGSGNNSLMVYPNPATDFIIIDPNITKKYDCKLYDILGQLIYSKEYVSGNLMVDVKNYNKGIYYLLITTDKNTISKRMVIE